MFIGLLQILLVVAASGFSSGQTAGSADKPSGEQKPAASADPMLVTVKVPVISSVGGNIPVATVNGDKITLEDLRDAIAETHLAKEGEKQDEVTQTAKIDFGVLLKRLINVQLIVQEASNMGLDELPEIKQEIDNFSKVTLRSLLREEIWKDLTLNEKEIEKLYRASVDEVKITLVPFKAEKDAKKAAAEIKAGKSFDNVTAQAVKDKKALGLEAGAFFKVEELAPEIQTLLPKMKPGAISPVRKINRGGKSVYAFFRLEEKRTTESTLAKEEARKKVQEEGRAVAVSKYLRSLYKTGVKTDVKLVESLDYGLKGQGLEKLMADQRVVVEIAGDKPVTVAELSAALQEKFFHGMKNINEKKLKQMKQEVLEEIVQKRLLHREALKRGIDKTEAYQRMYNDFKRNVLFNAFMERVVVPGIKMSDADLRAYYQDHPEEFRSSEMVKMRALAFTKKADAVAVVDKLRKGAEFGWVRTNAEGQLEKSRDKTQEQMLPFEEDQFTMVKALPEDIQKAVASPHPGDFRLLESPDGIYYVLNIQEVIPSTQQPFEEARDVIRTMVFRKKLSTTLDEWTVKLRESSEIKMYLSGTENK
jgi:parvulin-like peptidyl-prolyl isomerase